MTARTEAVMGTLVTIRVVRDADDERLDRAFEWFQRVEECCSRFDERSELAHLTKQAGVPVPSSEMLFQAVQFALRVAEDSLGAFDPTVGCEMEARGFNREHRTGAIVRAPSAAGPVSYRDVHLDVPRRTITLKRPLRLDLGAVAKGLAIDLAARELQPLADFMIDAGGDLYLGGCNAHGEPWSVGIRHPRAHSEIIGRLRVSNRAVCTSGDYERRATEEGMSHIIDPRGARAATVASVTTVGSSAMLADALSTAAFVLGPAEGIPFLERFGVDGLIVSPELEQYETRGLWRAA